MYFLYINSVALRAGAAPTVFCLTKPEYAKNLAIKVSLRARAVEDR